MLKMKVSPVGQLSGPGEQARPQEVHVVVGFTPIPAAAGIVNNINNNNNDNDSI